MGVRDVKQAELDRMIQRVIEESPRPVQDRTAAAMRLVAQGLRDGATFKEACAQAATTEGTARDHRKRYPAFDAWCLRWMAENAKQRKAAEHAERQTRLAANSLVAGQAPRPSRGTLGEFKWKYFGRPTLQHQELFHEALEDYTNLYVFCFMPPGAGKDTTAGDYCAWEAAPDTSGKTVAWFMESGPFSERRFRRLESYLIDPKAYEKPPSKTPGGQKPASSLIVDYGPFKWEAGMVWPDGTEVKKKPWRSNEKYFVEVDAPEQDPNLWATGVEGTTYGSRIKVCVCSDIFTLENQGSPTDRERQYSWLKRTLDSRLDDDGRLVVIGTMLPVENNYERLLDDFTEGQRVIEEKSNGVSTMVKYTGGVAVVTVKAIVHNPETGQEESFWPEMFPLNDTLITHDGKKHYNVDELDIERVRELTSRSDAKLRRGLKGRRARDPKGFEAMYQQSKDRDADTADFTDDVLEAAKDPKRGFGQVFAHELLVIGVDPARVYGAAWVCLAVDRRDRKVTLVDYFFGSNLGYQGIKSRLVIEPISRYNPMWFVYEPNKDGAILDDALIKEFLDETGVSVWAPATGRERGNPEIGPASIAPYMRTGEFRIPAATAADRQKFQQIKAHFKAWDEATHRNRTKPGKAGHSPDDIAMAAWVGWRKAREFLEDQRKSHGIRAPLPPGLRAKWDRMVKRASASSEERRLDRTGSIRERTPHVSAQDAILEIAGSGDD